MYVLRAFQPDNTPVPSERCRFGHLPIRIGRNPLNDFSPQHPMISAFHARIEDNDGRLCIRDLGSRNGVFVLLPGARKPERVDANSTAELAPAGYRFFLSGCVGVQLEIVDAEVPLRPEGSRKGGSVLGNVSIIALPGAHAPPAGPADPRGWGSPNAGPQHGSVPPAQGAGSGSPSNLPAAGPLPPLHGAQQGGPAPSLRRRSGEAPLGTQSFDVDLDFLALQGIRELAASLVPGRPIETTGDCARFITKLHDTVDVFCRSFVPLRQGYAQFVSSLDLAAQRSVNRSRAALALEAASTPEDVAMALLDPDDLSFDAPQAVEGIFADLMLHQVALLDGVMQGVRALLDELSPENIEAALGQRGTAGLFESKYRARWTEFCQRFERFNDERQAFSVIFGQDFAEVYRQYRRRKDTEDQGLRTEPPWR